MRRLELTHTAAGGPTQMSVRGARLVVAHGPDAGRMATIDQPTFVIGTGEAADVRLSDPLVSREHLRLSLTEKGVRVRDEGSKNGTWIGGIRIRDALLANDASLILGGTTLTITVEKDVMVLPLSPSDHFGDALGVSPVMKNLFATLERVAGTELSVLLEGEGGTGKDLLARGIHAASARAEAPFALLDCSSVPAAIVEAELFGQEGGARGVFAEADGGTVFLDEVGDLPLEVQGKLMRVLEAREMRPVGATSSRRVDVRVVAATSRRLAEAARTGEFRSDLYYRLAVARVVVPPLRDRPEDVLPIAHAMLRALQGDAAATIPPDLASMLQAYTWPGNVRELRNVIERWAALGRLDRSMFAETVGTSEDDELAKLPYHEARKIVLDRFEERYFPRVMARANGVVARAADLAQVARPSLYRMLERLKMSKRE